MKSARAVEGLKEKDRVLDGAVSPARAAEMIGITG